MSTTAQVKRRIHRASCARGPTELVISDGLRHRVRKGFPGGDVERGIALSGSPAKIRRTAVDVQRHARENPLVESHGLRRGLGLRRSLFVAG